ncbi:MAG TPA: hypothetical protein VE078_00940, partial [Thermoanaerobaculia bacterium]|nr:hypothetical protein [Thermoanaerobaculia bacterium]
MRAVLTACLVSCLAASSASGQGNWTSLGPQVGSFSSNNLVVDPFTPATLYATFLGADAHSGLWKSSDGGRHWRSVNAGLETPYISSIAADPFHADTLFAAVSLSTGTSLRRSDDGGESWIEVFSAGPGSGVGMSQLIADPVTPGDLWFESYGDVGHSEDGGATWVVAHPGNGGSSMDLAVDPLNPQNIYFSDSYVLWKSTDRGATWNWLYGPNSMGFDWVVPASRPPAVLYARPTLTYGTPPAPRHCVRSTDQGATWIPMPLPDPTAVCHSLILDPLDSRHIWVLDVLKHKIFISTDGGSTWPEVRDRLPADSSSLFRRDHKTGALYIGTDSGVSRSDDDGETWEEAGQGIVATKVETLFAAPGGNGGQPVLFAQARLRPMTRSADGGRTWLDLRRVGGSAFAADPKNPTHLFLASSLLSESYDAGRTWTRLGSLPSIVSHLVVHPANPRVLYAAGPGAAFFRSRDGGRTWQRARAGLPVDPPCDRTFCYPSLINDLTIDPAGVLVVAAERQLFRSTDAGQRWQPVPLAAGVTALAQHPRSRALYAAGGSLSRSTDGGATWTEVGPLPATLTDLLVDPRGGGVLYAASEEGVFRS